MQFIITLLENTVLLITYLYFIYFIFYLAGLGWSKGCSKVPKHINHNFGAIDLIHKKE